MRQEDPPILLSACLAGRPCAYDGRDRRVEPLADILAAGRAVATCPEEDGGLPTPRPPAEIQGGDGGDVLDGRARVIDIHGRDATAEYLAGARIALERALRHGCRRAVLKARSPSCGSRRIYDGSHSGRLRPGCGVACALLRRHGIEVASEEELEAP